MSKKLKLKLPKEIIAEPFVVSVEKEDKPKVVKKRCPRGTRRNKLGDCVPTEVKAQPAPEVPPEIPTEIPPEAPPKVPPEVPPKVPPTKISTTKLINKPILDELRRQLPIFQFSNEKRKSPETTLKPAPEPVSEPEVAIIPEPETKPTTTTTTLNEILKKRERTDYVRNQKEGLDTRYSFLYPELDDPFFNVKIASKKEFHDTQYDGTIHDIEARANEM